MPAPKKGRSGSIGRKMALYGLIEPPVKKGRAAQPKKNAAKRAPSAAEKNVQPKSAQKPAPARKEKAAQPKTAALASETGARRRFSKYCQVCEIRVAKARGQKAAKAVKSLRSRCIFSADSTRSEKI